MATPEPSEARKTVLAVLKAYDDWILEDMLKYRSESCVHEILPKSLAQPSLNNTQYRAYFGMFIPYLRNFKLEIHDIIEDSSAPIPKIVVHATSSAVSDIGPYGNEYILIFHLAPDGKKVDKFIEYVDSAVSIASLTKLVGYIRMKEAEKAEKVKAKV